MDRMRETPLPLLDDRFPLPLDRPFTLKQARREGVSAHALGSLVREGLLRRPLRGVYVASQVPDSRDLRRQVLALAVPPGSVLTDWSATWFWTGLDHPAAHTEVVPLSVFRFRGHDRLRNPMVVSGERWLLPSDTVEVENGLRVSTPLRTAWDLGRFSPRIVAIGGMDGLARGDNFTRNQLVAGVERFARQRGVVQLRELAPLVDGRAESPGESALRLRWLDIPSMPPPEPQISVRDACGREWARLDLGVSALRFAAEYDGEEWHSAPEDRARDRRRRDELREREGWQVAVFRRENVFGREEDASVRLPLALQEARTSLHTRLAR